MMKNENKKNFEILRNLEDSNHVLEDEDTYYELKVKLKEGKNLAVRDINGNFR